MSSENNDPLGEIWADDLFSRRSEAQLLVDYIECVANRPNLREDMRSFTLAVDVGYGEGKTFFLRRLAKHLKISHPVAFIDAWADDLADQPLTALTVTLKHAFLSLESKPTIQTKLNATISKIGNVASIVAMGALKRGASYLISEAAVGAVDRALTEAPDLVRRSVNRAADIGEDAVELGLATFSGAVADRVMRERMALFEEGKAAIDDLKQSLSSLVGALSDQSLRPPVIIIVDELDRCRPTYAIKLLEEIKHLFDVPGLVFVFGMHGEQLAHAVSAAYGSQFDGKAYLRRFITRRYRLRQPDLQPLLTKLLNDAGLNDKLISSFFIVSVDGMQDRPALPALVAKYMRDYALPIREVYHVVDMLQTCAALARGQTLYAPYLLPLLMGRILGTDGAELVAPRVDPKWTYIIQDYRTGTREEASPWSVAQSLHKLFRMSNRELSDKVNSNDDILVQIAAHMKSGTQGLSDPSNYGQLLDAVGRFSGPQAGS